LGNPYFKPIDAHTSSGVVLRGRLLNRGRGRNSMLILVDGKYEVRAKDLFVADGKWHTVYFRSISCATSGRACKMNRFIWNALRRFESGSAQAIFSKPWNSAI
jgi:hypothetical protein